MKTDDIDCSVGKCQGEWVLLARVFFLCVNCEFELCVISLGTPLGLEGTIEMLLLDSRVILKQHAGIQWVWHVMLVDTWG